MEQLTDVWTLETPDEEFASEDLNFIIEQALNGDFELAGYLCQLWDGESRESIVDKLETEGSVWYVWYMDGVRQHSINMAS